MLKSRRMASLGDTNKMTLVSPLTGTTAMGVGGSFVVFGNHDGYIQVCHIGPDDAQEEGVSITRPGPLIRCSDSPIDCISCFHDLSAVFVERNAVLFLPATLNGSEKRQVLPDGMIYTNRA